MHFARHRLPSPCPSQSRRAGRTGQHMVQGRRACSRRALPLLRKQRTRPSPRLRLLLEPAVRAHEPHSLRQPAHRPTSLASARRHSPPPQEARADNRARPTTCPQVEAPAGSACTAASMSSSAAHLEWHRTTTINCQDTRVAKRDGHSLGAKPPDFRTLRTNSQKCPWAPPTTLARLTHVGGGGQTRLLLRRWCLLSACWLLRGLSTATATRGGGLHLGSTVQPSPN